ncbi:MAG: BatD family protein, partial [Chthoniobacterales bacterium]
GPGGIRGQPQMAMEFMYKVTALEPGTHTIPSFKVDVGGKPMKTESAKLRVVDVGGPVPRALPVQPSPGPNVPGAVFDPFQLLNQVLQGGSVQIPLPGSPGFPLPVPQPGMPQPDDVLEGKEFDAEMTLGAKTAFVGEAVPLDLRFYFRADMVPNGFQLEADRIRLSGDGFTVAGLSQPTETTVDRDGVSYSVFTSHTTITPNKTGDLDIPPAELAIKVFTRQMFGQTSQDKKIPTNKAKLRVEPLPEEVRPLSFSGAIGQDFDLSADVDPRSAQPGEPLNYTLTLKGRGNFDVIVAPELNSVTGWKTYQPKENFEPDDAAGFGGTKTFAYKIVARHNQTATPGAEFSYFDPSRKEYITLKADSLPVDAKGLASQPDEPPQQGGGSAEPENALSSGKETIADPAQELGPPSRVSMAALAKEPLFWWINLSLAAAFLIALPVVLWLRRRAVKNAAMSELHWALKQARSALVKASDRTEFYNAAAHFVQASLAVGEGKKARFVDTADALKRQVKDPVFRREIEAVLGRRDEMKYGGRSAGSLDLAEKNRVVSLLDKFSNKHD